MFEKVLKRLEFSNLKCLVLSFVTEQQVEAVLKIRSNIEILRAVLSQYSTFTGGIALIDLLKKLLDTTRFPQEIKISGHKHPKVSTIVDELNARKEQPEFFKKYFEQKGYDDVLVGFLHSSLERSHLTLVEETLSFRVKHSLTLLKYHIAGNSFLRKLTFKGEWSQKTFISMMFGIKFLKTLNELRFGKECFSKESVGGWKALEKECGNVARVEFDTDFGGEELDLETNILALGNILLRTGVPAHLKIPFKIKTKGNKILLAFYEKSQLRENPFNVLDYYSINE